MKRLSSTAGLTLVLAATLVSCDKIYPPQPELQRPPVMTEETRKQEQERTAFAQAAQKELDELRAVIAEFRARAEAANLQTKAVLAAEVETLEVELREAQQHLAELKSAALESWKQAKQSFGSSLEKLKTGIENYRKSGR